MEANEVPKQGNKIPREKLERLEDLLSNNKIVEFFGLSFEEIREFLKSMDFSKRSFSPMFLSPGYLDNKTLKPQIKTSLWANSLDTIFHEAKHGLHYLACVNIFKDLQSNKEAFSLFCKNVLGDEKFIRKIYKKGTKYQKQFIQLANDLKNKNIILPEDISNLSVILGALTYQHAYFVDPGMCEAVASYGDFGQTRIVNAINRIGVSIIPISTFPLKGYGNKNYQKLFEKAHKYKKAFLVRKEEYKRKLFFNNFNKLKTSFKFLPIKKTATGFSIASG